MICPGCAHHNPEGRKYCRACAKPLAPASEAAPSSRVVSSAPARTAATAGAVAQPRLNKMAVASLVSGFVALLPPLGLAAVVFGHVSRNQIAKSGGGERGAGIAFAGLILGYGQLAIFAILLLGFMGLVRDIRFDLARHPDTREALLERIAHGDPNEVTPAKSARHQEAAVQALDLIRAKETEYLAAHPDEGYACQMYKVGFDPGADTELNTLFRESDYDTKFIRCGSIPGVTPGELLVPPMYLIISVPRSQGNPVDAPSFCLDQVNGIEQYNNDEWRNAIGAIATSHSDPCPLTGAHVD
jgi:uncharacterized protein DUF4190